MKVRLTEPRLLAGKLTGAGTLLEIRDELALRLVEGGKASAEALDAAESQAAAGAGQKRRRGEPPGQQPQLTVQPTQETVEGVSAKRLAGMGGGTGEAT